MRESGDAISPSPTTRSQLANGIPLPSARAGFTDPADYLSAFFRYCPLPVTQADLDGVLTFWNPAAAQFYGYSAEEAVGQHVSMLVPDELASGPQFLIEMLRNGQVIENFETVGLTRDGRRIPVAFSVFPMRDADGQLVGSSSISQDITARKLAERTLVESERRFRAAFDVTPAPMSLIGLDGRFILVNRATSTLLGYSADEMVGMRVNQVLPPEEAELDVGADLLYRGKNPDVDPELPLVRRDGSLCWVSMSVAVLEDELGEPAYFLTHGQDLTEQRAAQERLANERAHYHDLLDRVGSAYVEVDWDWHILRMNAAAEAIIGVSRRQLIGRTLHDALDPPSMADFAGILERAMRERQPIYVPEYFYRPKQIWLALHFVPTAEGLAIHVRDVTEQRNIEDDLREAETRFQILVENLPAAVYVLGAGSSSDIRYLSPYFEVMTGYTAEQRQQQLAEGGWLSIVHPEDRERVRNRGYEAMAGLDRIDLEYRLRKADGSYICVNNVASILRDDDGKIVAWMGILLDITQQREAREAMARLAAIVDTADDIIYSRTVDGTITSWNAGAERITGYPAREVMGRNLREVFPDDNIQLPTLEDLESREPSWRFTARVHRRDGEVIDLAMAVSKLVDAEGKVTGLSAIARDISAQLAAERELRDAFEAAEAGERTKALFLAMMSHELRTPLQSVLGYADLLLGGHDGELSPMQLEDIRVIHQGATRMVSLIEHMLDLSRMESGRLDMKSEVIDLASVLNAVVRAIKPQAVAKNLAVVLETPGDLPDVLGDQDRVKQILLSMVDNAVKFTSSGEVRISARTQGDWLETSVKDTGIGIEASQLDHVFDMFRHGDDRISRRHGGAGLGLAVAQRLARQMEGDITVSSVPGEGSTFTLRLPTAGSLRRRWQVTSADTALI